MDVQRDISPFPDRDVEAQIKKEWERHRRAVKIIRAVLLLLVAVFVLRQTVELASIVTSAVPLLLAFMWFGLGVAFTQNNRT